MLTSRGWSSVKAKRYRARLIRRHYIAKSDGRQRPLGIPLPVSFGYRPGVGAKEAVRALTFNLQYGCFGYSVEADVKAFFDRLDHAWLLRMLRLRIRDEAVIGLIGKWLKAGVLEEGEVVHPVTGSPQGGVVTPPTIEQNGYYTAHGR